MNNEKQTSKILVVDDEPDLQSLIRQKFRSKIKSNEYEFSFAENGEEALKFMTNNGTVDLILTDINMPVMDGLTLLTRLNELNDKLIRSVIVSAYGDMENIRTAMNRGAYDFITKPIDLKDLEITVEKAIDNLNEFKNAVRARDELVTVRNELEEARKLQLSMLPKDVPKIEGLEFAVYMKTASEVGGDYYDFSYNKDGSLNIAFGDATGHGMNAGIMVAIMKTLFISDSVELNMEEFFNISNKTIKSLNLGRMMMAFAMINIKGNKADMITAGMPPVYYWNREKRTIVELSQHNFPLGAMTVKGYNRLETELNKGDLLIMMSDGFPELQSPEGEQYGYPRVHNSIEKVIDRNPEEIVDFLNEQSTNWTNNADLKDDITFVVIKAGQ